MFNQEELTIPSIHAQTPSAIFYKESSSGPLRGGSWNLVGGDTKTASGSLPDSPKKRQHAPAAGGD